MSYRIAEHEGVCALGLRWRELTTAAAFALLAVVFIVEGRELALEARGIPGPGLFPVLVAATTLVFSAALAVSAVVSARRGTPLSAPPREAGETTAQDSDVPVAPPEERADTEDREDAEDGAGTASWRRPAFLWLAVLACSLLMTVVGFVPAMVLLAGLLLIGMERRRDRLSYVGVVAVPVALYVLFAVLLDVRLPAGLFG
jgi:putative tricarboxylic transport membrane protein